MKQLRKILPCTLDNGQYDAYYALKAKDDLSKINVTARGSTTVTIFICDRQGEYNGHYIDTPMSRNS